MGPPESVTASIIIENNDGSSSNSRVKSEEDNNDKVEEEEERLGVWITSKVGRQNFLLTSIFIITTIVCISFLSLSCPIVGEYI